MFEDRGVLIGRDEIDTFEADADGFFAQLIEGEPFRIGPEADGLFEAPARRFGSGERAESEGTGSERGFDYLATIHRIRILQLIYKLANTRTALRQYAVNMSGVLCDEDLMMRLCSAEAGLSETLFAELFERYKRPVYSWCYRICRDRNTASDLAQEIFFKAWKHRASFQGNSKLSTWLYAIARNHCLTALKRRACDPLRFEFPPHANLRDDETLAADVAAERQQSSRRLMQLMSRTLEPLEIRVMTLHYAHSVPLAVITHDLRLKNPSGAKAYIVNSRRKLNAVLRRSPLGGHVRKAPAALAG